jgi:hypothetical protein
MAETRAVKLFGSAVQAEAHAKLDEILAAGKYPWACCYEDVNDPETPYQVWSDSKTAPHE